MEYLKHPERLAVTCTGFCAPPMIVSGGSKGEDGPGSTMNPVPFEEVWNVTAVPGFTHKSEFPFALGKPGVAVAEFMPSRLISTVQEPDAEQVLSAVQRLW